MGGFHRVFHQIKFKAWAGNGSIKSYKLETFFSNSIFKMRWFSSSSSSPLFSISQVHLINSKKFVNVKFANGSESNYPWTFLQDNCTCLDCFHPSSKSRKRLMTNLVLDKIITGVSVVKDENSIRCTWEDGHEGIFSEKWLMERRFEKENIQGRITGLREECELIGADYEFQRESFDNITRDPMKLSQMLKTLAKFGVYLVEAAPRKTGQLREVVNKIGFIRTTHYGDEFTVKSERNASNLAYTSGTLCVHTDLPYYVYPPGVQLLHCIKQFQGEDGGYSHLVDGFLVAAQMKQDYPDMYRILGDTFVEFADVGQDFTKFDKIHHSPTFVHCERSKKLTRIVYSNQQLSSVLPIPLEKVQPFYEAMKLFTTLCYAPKNLMRFKLKEGDILIFDNWRMLHGREGYDASKGDRHLEGCYVDWDEVFSTIRVLNSDIKKF